MTEKEKKITKKEKNKKIKQEQKRMGTERVCTNER